MGTSAIGTEVLRRGHHTQHSSLAPTVTRQGTSQVPEHLGTSPTAVRIGEAHMLGTKEVVPR